MLNERVFHQFRDADEFFRALGGEAFQEEIKFLFEFGKARVHREAVGGVDDSRHAGHPRCHSAHEARFGGVGMHDVELFRFDEAVKLPEGDEVLRRNSAADIDREEGDVRGLHRLLGVEIRSRGVGHVAPKLFQFLKKGNEEGSGGYPDSGYFQDLFQFLFVGDGFAAVVFFKLAARDVARAEAVVAAAIGILGDLDSLGGNANHGRVFRRIFKHNGVGAYDGIVADGYGADYFGARADEDVVADGGNPCVVHFRLSDDHLSAYDAVSAYFGRRVDVDGARVQKDDPRAYGGLAGQGTVVNDPHDHGEDCVGNEEDPVEGRPKAAHKVAVAVNQRYVQRRYAEDPYHAD